MIISALVKHKLMYISAPVL